VSSSEDSNEQVGYKILPARHIDMLGARLACGWRAANDTPVPPVTTKDPSNCPERNPSPKPPPLVESIAMALCRAARFLLNFIRVRHMHNTDW